LLASSTKEVRVADGQRNITDHTELLAALEKKDSALARDLIVRHIKRAMTDRLALQSKI
jgi:DNA-binding GntR family transcriptional regulator